MKILIKFDRNLIFQGFERILKVFLMIFGVVKSDEMLNFSMFCRSVYRSGVFEWIWVKCLGNADFTRSLWIEEICLVCNRTLVLKM